MSPPLAARGLACGYSRGRSRRAVLAGVTAELAAGSVTALLGANGAGKSTLLRTLAGLQRPLGGRVELAGTPLAALRAGKRARLVATVLTDRVDAGLLSAHEVVALGRYPHTGPWGRPGNHDRQVVAESLELLSATKLAEQRFSELSDGQRQRVLIARALAQEPMVLLLDEPTAFLDATARVELMVLLAQIAAERQVAVLVSTHELSLALRLADTVWLALPGEGGGHTAPPGRIVSGPAAQLAASGLITAAFASKLADFDPVSSALVPRPSGRACAVGLD